MSFVGAVASPVRQVLASFARDLRLPALVCGAGNFTVPSALRSGGFSGAISACDVSVYSSALGAYLSGNQVVMREQPDCPERLRGLLRPAPPLDLAASVALLLDLRECWQCRNPYQERVFAAVRDNWEALLAATRERLAAFAAHLGPITYQAQDGFAFMEAHGPGHVAFAFPPTYRAGYEKLEKLFGAVLEWAPPAYREMTDRSIDLYELVLRFDSWFVVLEKGPEELPEAFDLLGQPAAVLPRGRGKRTYVMAKAAPRRIVLRQQVKSADIGPVWPPDRPVTGQERVSLGLLTLGQSLRMNELFLSARVDYFTGGVGLSLALLLDGLAIGKADFCPSSHVWKLPEPRPMIYLMCDLAVPSCEKRLAKLVLLLLLSREVKDLADARWLERFGWVITTAFSRGPASMKYRGVFRQHKRAAAPGGFALNLYAPFGELTAAEALATWVKKYRK